MWQYFKNYKVAALHYISFANQDTLVQKFTLIYVIPNTELLRI